MNKARKMRRYERKDYSQLVDFPVEIVGRDTVIRRYSYEESIRLYERRIDSAPARYHDDEVVEAEVVHCRQRISQLRRSYFARYGWSALRVDDRPGLLAGEFAGEVAAFLRRIGQLAPEAAAPGPALHFALIEDRSDHQLYYIRPAEAEGHALWLLYLYRFSASQACASREGFFHTLKLLQSVTSPSERVEQVLGFHHTADCGIILSSTDTASGTRAHAPPVGRVGVEWLEFAAVDGDPLQAAFSALRRGRLSDALVRFTEAYEAQPFRRAAYVGAGVIADQLGAFDAAETAALMGVRYLREDNLIQHHLALVALRQGRLPEARAALKQLSARVPEADSSMLLEGLVELSSDRWLSGLRRVRSVYRRLEGEDPDLAHAAVQVLSMSLWGALGSVGGLVLAGLPYGAAAFGFSWPVVMASGCLLVGVAVAAASAMSTRTRIHRLIRAPSGWGLRLSNPQCLRDGRRDGAMPWAPVQGC